MISPINRQSLITVYTFRTHRERESVSVTWSFPDTRNSFGEPIKTRGCSTPLKDSNSSSSTLDAYSLLLRWQKRPKKAKHYYSTPKRQLLRIFQWFADTHQIPSLSAAATAVLSLNSSPMGQQQLKGLRKRCRVELKVWLQQPGSTVNKLGLAGAKNNSSSNNWEIFEKRRTFSIFPNISFQTNAKKINFYIPNVCCCFSKWREEEDDVVLCLSAVVVSVLDPRGAHSFLAKKGNFCSDASTWREFPIKDTAKKREAESAHAVRTGLKLS